MWVLTRSEWPVLVNLSVTASIGYFQVAKFDERMHVVATAWEAEHVLADCVNGVEARAIVEIVARSLQQGARFLDLNTVDVNVAPDADAVDEAML